MNYRYPGPQSFSEEDELLFHGRKREIKALHDLIMAQTPVVLFAKSGMGKTSLLQAGILPKLRFSSFDAIKIRLNQTATPLEKQVLGALLPNLPTTTTIWEALIQYNRKRLGTPILIFDQFEEVFTLYSEEERKEFVHQLADVINQYLPEKIRAELRQRLAAKTLTGAESAALEQPPLVKIVFSIRSDLLHCLHDLSDEIPSILRNRFELRGLERDQAREAVVGPSAQPRELGDFISPDFGWSKSAVDEILTFLGRRQQASTQHTGGVRVSEIETFQLQLLCENIEKKVASMAGQRRIEVSPDFYGGEAGIEQVLANFYENTLSLVTNEDTRARARRLLEDHLIKNQRRVSVDETTIELTHGVLPNVLNLLVEARLLRRDPRETGNYYEISHDALLQPMLRSKTQWDQVESERLAQDAADKLAQETRRRRRATMIATSAAVLALAAMAAFSVAFWQFRKAENAKTEILKKSLAARRNFAEVLKVEGKYSAAIGQLDTMMVVFASDLDPLDRSSIARTRDNWQQVGKLMTEASDFEKNGELRIALEKYQAAQKISPDTRIGSLIEQLEKDIEIAFNKYFDAGENHAQFRRIDLAIDNYQKALKVKNDELVIQKLKKLTDR